MSEHRATIRWEGATPEFVRGRYTREHLWAFDGGQTIAASAAPSAVPAPYSNPALVDPEEAFVAAIASCHMLTYLHLASREGYRIDRYEDQAVGRMTPDERGIPWVSEVELSPRIDYGGDARPTPAEEDRLHHLAHERCFIANSVRTAITVLRPGG